ncbi:MAG: class I SAM-dependent methyltransferase [Pseudomonadota bacterium]
MARAALRVGMRVAVRPKTAVLDDSPRAGEDSAMDPVSAQYEAFPYPARDPADEAVRLIEGSPSHPLEIDHYLYRGQRDWRAPFRALVAGGGTGDALVMLAQKLADIGCPAELTYLDLSRASRSVAEARMAARGLSARFVTGDLLEAPDFGPFDYIDCCGVLHHLEDPDAGFAALARALAPGGGMGLMVYAPYGRIGVYMLQSAFRRLMPGSDPAPRLALGRAVMETLPPAHWFRLNRYLGDHLQSDAGFYDLLLHGRDRSFAVGALDAALAAADLTRIAFTEPALYDPARLLPDRAEIRTRLAAMPEPERAALAEELSGALKTHTLYAAREGEAEGRMALATSAQAVPHLRGAAPEAMAREVAKGAGLTVAANGTPITLALPPEAARAIALIDGRRSLGALAERLSRDWMSFAPAWVVLHRELCSVNLLHYSRGARV